jgi:hypothetical protein
MYVVKVAKNLHLYLKLITKIEITNVLDVFTYFDIPYLWLLHSTAFWQCLCCSTFPVVLYGCETWSLTLREERRLRVFENRMLWRIFGPKRDKVIVEW